MNGYVVVLITAPKEKGQEIADFIVKNKLGACVNVVPSVSSTYWWKGNIEKDEESLLVVKTTTARLSLLTEMVKEVHPYTVPEIIALPIVGGNDDYLHWIGESII
ncbi:MAG: divalent-cation tolerance protein CutA [Aquificota bacterium]|nr:divalent-cation tolerance protein CutA [Aquificota bacterium]